MSSASRHWIRFLLLSIGSVVSMASGANELDGKVIVGYQGWFGTPLDTPDLGWNHWSYGGASPTASDIVVDMWPDTSEYPPAPSLALDATGLFLPNGQPAYLFSASAGATPVVTDLHFKWMQQYGIDVANVSRFLVGIVANSATSTFISQVLANVQSSATKYSRQFAIVYDITNAYSPPSGGNPSCYSKTIRSAVVPNFFNCVTSDWMNLVNAGVTQSPAYFKVNGLPYVSIFGLGFADQNGNTYDDSSADALKLVQWFTTTAPAKYRAYIAGGVPTGWRTLSGNSQTDPQWSSVYAAFDALWPWTVGGYTDPVSAYDYIALSNGAADIALANSRGQYYLPVIFPGFSWHNLATNSKPPFQPSNENQIPRDRGNFLWSQAYDFRNIGAKAMMVAMFDEVNEGTAIFKTAPNASAAPVGPYTLTLDADGYALPSDWYLQVTAQIAASLSTTLAPAIPLTYANVNYGAGHLSLASGSTIAHPLGSLAFQTDGNLVLYNTQGAPLWNTATTETCGTGGCAASFQADGNLVLYKGSSSYWSSNTSGNPGAALVLGAQGSFLSVVSSSGSTLWDSNYPYSLYPSATFASNNAFRLTTSQILSLAGGLLKLQTDGNLVMYTSSGTPLWDSGTSYPCSSGACYLLFQSDGNLVLYSGSTGYWSTGTAGQTGDRLTLSTTPPYLKITSASGQPLVN